MTPPRSGAEGAALGALLGIAAGIVESALVAGAYWFELPSAADVRTFAATAVLLDAVGGAVLSGVLCRVLGRDRGWPLSVLMVSAVLASSHLAWNFPGKAEGIGGTRVAIPLAFLLASGLAVLSRPVPRWLPRGGIARPRYVILLVAAGLVALYRERLPAASARGPNVLMLVVDTLRADAPGYAGAGTLTPHVDRLSRRGAVFQETVTSSNATPSAIASLLTSLPVSRHGVNGFHVLLDEGFLTLPEVLEGRGYRTFGFSSSFPAHQAYHQFDQGLQHADDTCIPRPVAWAPPVEALARLCVFRIPSKLGHPLLPENRIPSSREADLTVRAVRRFLATDGVEPFFGWIHLFDPHTPYSPPYAHSPYGGGLASIGQGELDARFAAAGMRKPDWLSRPVSVRDPAFPVDSYAGEVRFVDEQLARLLAALAGRGALGRTIVVLTADHGESLLEPRERMLFNHDGIFENVARVPLVMAGPGVPSGALLPWMARSLDVMPTVLDLCGAASPPGIEGSSLRPFLSGRAPAGEGTVLVEAPHNDVWALRVGSLKLLRNYPDRPAALYDLASDPGEAHDLARERPEVAMRMAAEALRRRARAHSGEAGALSPEIIESLRTLGYIEGPAGVPRRRP